MHLVLGNNIHRKFDPCDVDHHASGSKTNSNLESSTSDLISTVNETSDNSNNFISTDAASACRYVEIVKDLITQNFDPSSQFLLNPNKVKQHTPKKCIGYKCPICSKVFISDWLLLKHSLSHRKLVCNECNQVFFNEELLKIHFQKHLINSIKRDSGLCLAYCCSDCYSLNCMCKKDRFTPRLCTETLQQQSYIPASGMEHYRLVVDDMLSEDKTEIKKAEIVKTKENVKSLSLKTDEGQNVTEDGKLFKCFICSDIFTSKSKLHRHILSHEINFSQLSDARSSSKQSLKSNKSNSQLCPVGKSYLCFYCHQEFKRKSILRNHLTMCSNLLLDLVDFDLCQIECIGNTNYYHINRVVGQDVKKRCLNCKTEVIDFEYKHHKVICKGTLFETEKSLSPPSSNENNKKKNDNSNDPFNYICLNCRLPFSSRTYFIVHLCFNCQYITTDLKSKIQRGQYSSKNIDKLCLKSSADINPLHSSIKIEDILKINIITGGSPKERSKQIHCQFCNLNYSYLSLNHLINDCRGIPMILKKTLLKIDLDGRFFNKPEYSETFPASNISDEISIKNFSGNSSESSNSAGQQLLVYYDCHLCESKYDLEYVFLRHMSKKHGKNIDRANAHRWLSNHGNNEEIIEQEMEELTYAVIRSDDNTQENFRLSPRISYQERKMPQFDDHRDLSLLSSIGYDNSLILNSHYEFLNDNFPVNKHSFSAKEIILNKPSLPNSRLDGELDNCIETVQLEDKDFINLL